MNFLNEDRNYGDLINQQIQALLQQISSQERKLTDYYEKYSSQHQQIQDLMASNKEFREKQQNLAKELEKLQLEKGYSEKLINDSQTKIIQLTASVCKEKTSNGNLQKEIERMREVLRAKDKEQIKMKQQYEGKLTEERIKQKQELKNVTKDLE